MAPRFSREAKQRVCAAQRAAALRGGELSIFWLDTDPPTWEWPS